MNEDTLHIVKQRHFNSIEINNAVFDHWMTLWTTVNTPHSESPRHLYSSKEVNNTVFNYWMTLWTATNAPQFEAPSLQQ